MTDAYRIRCVSMYTLSTVRYWYCNHYILDSYSNIPDNFQHLPIDDQTTPHAHSSSGGSKIKAKILSVNHDKYEQMNRNFVKLLHCLKM